MSILPKITILTTIFVLFLNPASAISAGVSPSSIPHINTTQGNIHTINFSVVNTGNETTTYSISSRGNISNWTAFNTSSVVLEGKKSFPTSAKISIPKDLPDGIYKGDILIKSIPEGSGTGNKVSVVVNLPVTILVTKPQFKLTPIWLIIPLALLTVVLLLVLSKKKETK